MILLMHWAYWTLSMEFPAPVSLSSGRISAFIKESTLSWSQRKAGTQGPGALCEVIKLWAEEPLKCVLKIMENTAVLISVFTAWLWDLGLEVLWMLHTTPAVSNCYHGVGLSAAPTEKLPWGGSRKVWEKLLTMDLASLRDRVDSAHWQEQKVPTAMNMHAQENGAGYLPGGCTVFSQNLCLLGVEISDFWLCNSNLVSALNSLQTAHAPASHSLSRIHTASDSDETPHIAVIQLCCLPCHVRVAHQTRHPFHAQWSIEQTDGNIRHWPIRGKTMKQTAISGCLVAFSLENLNKKCLCCSGNLVSLHERTSQLLISFLPETKIWLPWSLSACWSNIHNHIRNYTANHFLTGSRTSEKYIWLG